MGSAHLTSRSIAEAHSLTPARELGAWHAMHVAKTEAARAERPDVLGWDESSFPGADRPVE